MKRIKLLNYVLVLFALIVAVFPFGSMVTASANEDSGTINGGYIDFHGIKLDPNTQLEAYGLKIDLMNHKYKLIATMGGKGWSRYKQEYTIVITFNNIKYTESGKEYVFRLLHNTILDMPSGTFWSDKVVKFTENIEVSLTNNYYKWFKLLEAKGELDFTDININILNTSNKIVHKNSDFLGTYVYNLEFPCKLTSYNVPAVVVDPNDDDFEIDFGNSGTNISPPTDNPDVDVQEFDLLEWIKNILFGTHTGFNQILQAVFWIAGVILFFGCLSLLAKVLKFFFN